MVLIIAVLLLAVTGFCIYQVNPKVGHHSEIKVKVPGKESSKIIVWTLANAILYMTKILWVVTVHGYMEESDVKSTCGGLR